MLPPASSMALWGGNGRPSLVGKRALHKIGADGGNNVVVRIASRNVLVGVTRLRDGRRSQFGIGPSTHHPSVRIVANYR